MNRYLLIESRDPFESNDVGRLCELAAGLKHAGHEVAVMLVQNGVLPARRDARRDGLQGVLDAGIDVHADEFSLRERGIARNELAERVQPAPIDLVIERMEAGWSAIWH
jgi:intracellular sulfur oxidation DsrE/DsrF family protein